MIIAAGFGQLHSASATEIKYTYDDLGRLESVTYPSKVSSVQTDTIVYTYDTSGNRVEVRSEIFSNEGAIKALMLLFFDQ